MTMCITYVIQQCIYTCITYLHYITSRRKSTKKVINQFITARAIVCTVSTLSLLVLFSKFSVYFTSDALCIFLYVSRVLLWYSKSITTNNTTARKISKKSVVTLNVCICISWSLWDLSTLYCNKHNATLLVCKRCQYVCVTVCDETGSLKRH